LAVDQAAVSGGTLITSEVNYYFKSASVQWEGDLSVVVYTINT